MHLYLIRHGEALTACQAQVDSDAERPLSEAGRQTMAAVGRGLRRLGVRPGRVGSSPLRRAQETAALICSVLPSAPAPEILTQLEPDEAPERFVEWMRGGPPVPGAIVAVGHQPLLGRLVDTLVPGFGPALGFPPGGVVWIECVGERPGVVRGWWSPEVFLNEAGPRR